MMLSSVVSSLASGAMVMAETASTSGWYGITSETLEPIKTTFTEALPVAIPFALAILGIRKGVSWFFGLIRGA